MVSQLDYPFTSAVGARDAAASTNKFFGQVWAKFGKIWVNFG